MAETTISSNVIVENQQNFLDERTSSTDLIGAVWRFLVHPGLLLGVSGLTLLLVILGFIFPQMPGQLVDDPAEATRWLLSVSTDYGATGNILRRLDFFDIIHGPLLRLLLTTIGLIFLVHLAKLLGAIFHLHQVPELFEQPTSSPAEPIDLLISQSIYRSRRAFPEPVDTIAKQIQSYLEQHFPQAQHCMVEQRHVEIVDELEASHHDSEADGTADLDATTPEQQSADAVTVTVEERFVSVRNLEFAYLQPMLVTGLLLVLLTIWFMINLGWEVIPPSLAPNQLFRYSLHDLEIYYQADESSVLNTSDDNANTPKIPSLRVRLRDSVAELPVETSSRHRLGMVSIWVEPGPPGLLVQTLSGEDVLTLPGQSVGSSTIGMTFPTPGSEESILIPALAVGLRILRAGDQRIEGDDGVLPSDTYLIELFESQKAEPIERIELVGEQSQIISIPDGSLALRFVPLPGLDVEVRYMPGAWLLLLALVLILVGAYGYRRQPAFILAQIGPWPDERAVVILQSDVESEVDHFNSWLASKFAKEDDVP